MWRHSVPSVSVPFSSLLPVGERFDLDGLLLLRFFFLLQGLGVPEWLIALLHPDLLEMERLHLDDWI